MLLFIASMAHAARFTEASLQRMAAELAPRVEAAAGRRFVEVPPLVIDDTAHILAAVTSASGEIGARSEQSAASVSAALAVYASRSTSIYVNSDLAGRFLSNMESWSGSAEAHMECVMAHELAHALQHQRGGLGFGSQATEMLVEGHATWVAGQLCDPKLLDLAGAALGAHRLQSSELTGLQRPYVVGEAAVSTLIAGAGPEAFWAALNGEALSADDLDHLADGGRLPGWDPDHMGADVGFAATWGLPTRVVGHSYLVAGNLLDKAGRDSLLGSGPALVLKWVWEGMEGAAIDLSFASAERAADVLDGRRRTFGRLAVPTPFPLVGYSGLSVVPRLPAKAAPTDSLGGLSATVRLLTGGPYRELWSQQGTHLRGVMIRGPVPARVTAAALVEWAGLALPGPAPGPAAPRAAAVLARVKDLPSAPAMELSADFLLSRLQATVREGGDCLAVYRALEAQVAADLAAAFRQEAADCARQLDQAEALGVLAPDPPPRRR